MVVGGLCHSAIELILKGAEQQIAIEQQLLVFENMPDDSIKWWKKWSREDIIKNFVSGVQMYLEEKPAYEKIIAIEQKIESVIEDEIGGKKLVTPISLLGIPDLVFEEFGEIIIEDFKFKDKKASEDEEVHPMYWMQAIFYYYLVKALLNRTPKEIRFREIKYNKNKDWSSQHTVITINFSSSEFETQKVYFWYMLLGMLKAIEGADADTYFPYNIFDRDDWRNTFDLLRSTQFWYKQDTNEKSDFTKIEHKDIKETQFLESKAPDTIEAKIKYKLQEFAIPLTFHGIQSWYSFDRYLFNPSRGVKMSELKKYWEDIAQATEKENIRVLAPVPGTKFVGIEIPKEERRFVQLESKERNMPIGVDIDGKVTYFDLTDSNTPHLIVAGKTGSGKSEFLKVLIETCPRSVELYLIDPKRVELAKYKPRAEEYGNEANEAYEMLEKLYTEMMKRYKRMEMNWVSNVKDTRYKRILCIIEEFANLRLDRIFGKDIEELIVKISNLGRAAGVHLVLATQRPDVTIISGRIKANIWSRVCFAVASQIDSKIILDWGWAEKLAGKWDMLYLYPGNNPERLQSFYI